MGAIFLGVNRGKRSVVLDLKTADGREALLKLVDTADVLMHSIRPQKLAAIGLDPRDAAGAQPAPGLRRPARLRRRRPVRRHAGVRRHHPGPVGLRRADGAAVRRRRSTSRRSPPTRPRGLVATHAILAALFARERTGKGGYVEVPMLESMVAFNLVEHLYGHHFEPPLADYRLSARCSRQHRRPYRTADGYLCAMPYTDAHWQRFFIEGGMPEAGGRPALRRHQPSARRTSTRSTRWPRRCIATRSTDAWLEVLRAARDPGLAHEPAGRPGGRRAPARPPASSRPSTTPRWARLRFPGAPVRIDRRQLPVRMAPRLGEHTHQVLREAGIAPLGTASPALQGARYDCTRIDRTRCWARASSGRTSQVGQQFQTFRRTVTETDLVNFISSPACWR